MESFEKIYTNHSKTVYAFLLTRTKDTNLAEELTQETFFQAVNSIDKFKGNSSIVTWLCGIAQNIWYKYLRDKKNDEIISENIYISTSNSIETEVLLKWDNIQILKLLHNLNEPMREVMYLRLIGNLSFRQIGEIMEKSENWARVNFYRGKEKIIKEVDKYE